MNRPTGGKPPAGRKGTFDGRNGCRKCFCVTFDKSNKTAVSGEDFFLCHCWQIYNYVPYLALILESGVRKMTMKRTISGMIGTGSGS
ncbi:MAG: hypothetical protein ACLSXO_02475 [Coprococcus sp.]